MLRLKSIGMGALLAICLLAVNVWADSSTAVGIKLFNGLFDGAAADGATELSYQIGSIYGGIPVDSLRKNADTVIVDTGFAFSNLRVNNIADQPANAQDSVFILYSIQNYGNWTDSFDVKAWLLDTTFIPNYFNIMSRDSVTARTDVNADVDTFQYGIQLAPCARDSFVIKLRTPKSDTAVDQDTVLVVLRIRDRHRVGTPDSWPNTSAYPVLDTNASYDHLHAAAGGADTLWDYGDIQYDTVKVTIGGPVLKLYKRTSLVNGAAARKPGDFIRYTIYYDNDGSAATAETTFIVDYLPNNVALVDTDTVFSGAGVNIKTYAMYGGVWLDRIPGLASKTTPIGNDSLLRIKALKFAVAPGIGLNNGTDNNASTMLRADDSTDTDAGWIKFRVRIR